MLKIGAFSKLSRISVRMLRHYDEIGLLCPQVIDRETGYRLYGEVQLFDASKIVRYREMGFGLAAISLLLQETEEERLRSLLLQQRQSLRKEAAEIAQRLQRLELAMAQLGKENSMQPYEVTVRELPARRVASVRGILERYEHEGRLWHVLMKETGPQNLRPAIPPLTISILHDREFQERDVDVEVQMAVEGTYYDTEHVRFQDLPPVLIASTIHRGGYDGIGQGIATLSTWIENSQYAVAGGLFEIYHVSPHETQNPDELVTEICFPVHTRT